MQKNVSIPSEFTLLSNNDFGHKNHPLVSIPSEFTLLSNAKSGLTNSMIVSIPSEFTLLSNLKHIHTEFCLENCFNTL